MPTSKNKHLTAGDRSFIEQGLLESLSIPEIARKIGVSPSTVTREIKRNSVKEGHSFITVNTRNVCLRKESCHHRALCNTGCIMPCKSCRESLCNKICTEYLPNKCPKHGKPPFVCNACNRRYGMGCEYEYLFYDAKIAHELAQQRKVESRLGIDSTREELEELVKIVRPLLKQGQSPEVIWANNMGKMSVSLRTFYNYLDIGVFTDIRNLDLPKKVRFKPRKKKGNTIIPRHDLNERTYEDFLMLPYEKQINAVEMDCVMGKHGEQSAILTLLFRRFNFQIMLYLKRHNQVEVAKALDMLEKLIGFKEFKKWFSIILTDGGSEFLDYKLLEKSCFSKKERCRVYYCDPMKSGQKGRCEKNHSELRRIIPKGTSFINLTPRKLAVISSHVNSYGRPQFGGASPYQLACHVLPEELLEGLGIVYIEPKDVVMKPTLIDL